TSSNSLLRDEPCGSIRSTYSPSCGSDTNCNKLSKLPLPATTPPPGPSNGKSKLLDSRSTVIKLPAAPPHRYSSTSPRGDSAPVIVVLSAGSCVGGAAA